jgi:hypothetical protein
MRPRAERAQLHPEVAVAASLDRRVGRLPEDREVSCQEVWPTGSEPTEAVEVGRHLLVVVPDPGDVDGWLHELGGEPELHGDAGLHVDRAAPPEVVDIIDRLESAREVSVDRHGVDMAGDDDAFAAAEGRTRHDRVPVARDLEVAQALDARLDGIRDGPLVARHRFDVAQLPGDLDRCRGEIERMDRIGYWHARQFILQPIANLGP